ncbi:hypothetical protein [Halomarina ordinaria]|uniref:Uncharacterized protein n=1 Tax=Halomarina ordinaria TaxID=3033939 RepID=A0ABD5U9H7_9EURY|nr:hypothetical protein [Halomarina sp. PSRA2]
MQYSRRWHLLVGAAFGVQVVANAFGEVPLPAYWTVCLLVLVGVLVLGIGARDATRFAGRAWWELQGLGTVAVGIA